MFTRRGGGYAGTGRGARSAVAGMAAWLVVASGALGLSAVVHAEGAGSEARDLSVAQTAFYTVHTQPATPVQGRLSVTAWVDQPNNTYAVGEVVRLFVRANKDAYVTVLNVGASGRTTVLFPNAYQTDTRVRAHQVVEIPRRGSGASIQVSGPTGRELIKVIASTNPAPLLGSWKSTAAGPFTRLDGDARSMARDLQVTMQGHTGGEWDDYNKVITTIPTRAAAAVPIVPAPTGTVWPSSPFGLRIATDKSAYRLGEPVTLYASTTAPCYLTLVNVGSSGQTRVLLPNAVQPQTLLPAGQTVVFPALGSGLQLMPMGPVGMETVVAICSSDSQPVIGGGYTYGPGGFAALNVGGDVLTRDLSVVGTTPQRQVSQMTVGYLVSH